MMANSLSGFSADTLSIASASFASAGAGTSKVVTAAGVALDGADKANYVLAAGAVTTATDIARRTVTGSITASDKQYDGTTAATIVRDDGSTAHEGIFDLETGRFLRQTTHQGLAPESAWARGLAWSLYGFSQCYGLTGDYEYLEVAERNARYWIAHLPPDGVPFWDFDADTSRPPPLGAQKESSAAAIAASGLLDLAGQTRDRGLAGACCGAALRMLDALLTPEYLADQTPGWEGILKHGVYHTTKNLGVDESVMWGEFFFVEVLTKVALMGQGGSARPIGPPA